MPGMAERYPTPTASRPFSMLALLAVLIVWSVLAWAFIFAFSGGHVCFIGQQVVEAGDGTLRPMTDAEMAAATAARCNRPDVGAIAVFGIGYVVIAGVVIVRALSWWRARSGDAAHAPPTR
jgi:hypothetical protein